MSAPFLFRHANAAAGCFVSLTAVVLLGALLFSARVQGWLEPRTEIVLRLPEAGSEGLREGAEVTVLGTRVGKVDAIELLPDGHLTARLKIRRDYFQRFIRSDSEAVIRKKFGVGEAMVEITRGHADELPVDRTDVPVRSETSLTDQLESVSTQITAQVSEVLEEVRLTVIEARGLITDIRDPTGEVMRTLVVTRAMLEDIHAGRGTAGLVLFDEDTRAETEASLRRVHGLIDTLSGATTNVLVQVEDGAARIPPILVKVDGTLSNLQQSVAEVPRTMSLLNQNLAHLENTLGALAGQGDAIPRLVQQISDSLKETEILIKGIQNHWLLRKYVDENGTPALPLSPEELRALERR